MVKELVEAFEQFQLVVDRETGNSKGYGFFVYQDHSVTDVACQGLHGMKMGEKSLTVQRAMQGAPARPSPPPRVFPDTRRCRARTRSPRTWPGLSGARRLSRCRRRRAFAPGVEGGLADGMLDVEELRDDVEYGEIMEDMREECGKFGRIESIVIPRPDDTELAKPCRASEGFRVLRGPGGRGVGEERAARAQIRRQRGQGGLHRRGGVRLARVLARLSRTTDSPDVYRL